MHATKCENFKNYFLLIFIKFIYLKIRMATFFPEDFVEVPDEIVATPYYCVFCDSQQVMAFDNQNDLYLHFISTHVNGVVCSDAEKSLLENWFCSYLKVINETFVKILIDDSIELIANCKVCTILSNLLPLDKFFYRTLNFPFFYQYPEHVAKHFGYTPYLCLKCSKKFGTKERLNLHLVVNHKITDVESFDEATECFNICILDCYLRVNFASTPYYNI